MNWQAIFRSPGFCSAMGALALWLRFSVRSRITFWRLRPLLERLLGRSVWCDVLELAIFVSFGAFIAVEVTGANTCLQAFTAGLGWTGLISSRR